MLKQGRGRRESVGEWRVGRASRLEQHEPTASGRGPTVSASAPGRALPAKVGEEGWPKSELRGCGNRGRRAPFYSKLHARSLAVVRGAPGGGFSTRARVRPVCEPTRVRLEGEADRSGGAAGVAEAPGTRTLQPKGWGRASAGSAFFGRLQYSSLRGRQEKLRVTDRRSVVTDRRSVTQRRPSSTLLCG